MPRPHIKLLIHHQLAPGPVCADLLFFAGFCFEESYFALAAAECVGDFTAAGAGVVMSEFYSCLPFSGRLHRPKIRVFLINTCLS